MRYAGEFLTLQTGSPKRSACSEYSPLGPTSQLRSTFSTFSRSVFGLNCLITSIASPSFSATTIVSTVFLLSWWMDRFSGRTKGWWLVRFVVQSWVRAFIYLIFVQSFSIFFIRICAFVHYYTCVKICITWFSEEFCIWFWSFRLVSIVKYCYLGFIMIFCAINFFYYKYFLFRGGN